MSISLYACLCWLWIVNLHSFNRLFDVVGLKLVWYTRICLYRKSVFSQNLSFLICFCGIVSGSDHVVKQIFWALSYLTRFCGFTSLSIQISLMPGYLQSQSCPNSTQSKRLRSTQFQSQKINTWFTFSAPIFFQGPLQIIPNDLPVNNPVGRISNSNNKAKQFSMLSISLDFCSSTTIFTFPFYN